MKTPRTYPRHTENWSANRRIAALAAVLAVLLAAAGLAAWFTGRAEQTRTPTSSPAPAVSPSATATATGSVGAAGSVPKPPQTRDPVTFAKAAAAALWSYDTRTTSREQELAGLRAWMTRESTYADWPAITAQVPDAVLWSRMADNQQYATAHIAEGHYPSPFTASLARDPAALTVAYIYAVTVTGTQSIAWKGGGAGAEARLVTLAVQCRLSADCSLVSIAPQAVP